MIEASQLSRTKEVQLKFSPGQPFCSHKPSRPRLPLNCRHHLPYPSQLIPSGSHQPLTVLRGSVLPRCFQEEPRNRIADPPLPEDWPSLGRISLPHFHLSLHFSVFSNPTVLAAASSLRTHSALWGCSQEWCPDVSTLGATLNIPRNTRSPPVSHTHLHSAAYHTAVSICLCYTDSLTILQAPPEWDKSFLS